jgi:hypothetical protein
MVDRDHQHHSSPPLRLRDIIVTAALIVLPFIVGFQGRAATSNLRRQGAVIA